MVAKKNLVKLYEHEGIQYRSGKFICNQCSIPFTFSRVRKLYQRSEHEGVTYQCDKWDYKATQEIHLVQHKHKQCKHEGVKYKFGQCDYEGTSKFNVKRHKKAEHEGIQ